MFCIERKWVSKTFNIVRGGLEAGIVKLYNYAMLDKIISITELSELVKQDLIMRASAHKYDVTTLKP